MDLVEKLESSLAALSTGGRFALSSELPSETELASVHAMLDRVTRSQRLLRPVAVLPMPEEP